MAKQDDLMKSLVAKIYQVLNAGDSTAPNRNDFISWCAPGLPIDAQDLEFISTGGLGTGGTSADRIREFLNEAEDFARLVNFIPNTSGIYDKEQQQTTYSQDGTLLWDVYEAVLTQSQVASYPLSDSEKEKLNNAQQLLTVVEKQIAGVDDNFKPTYKEVEVDSPMMKAYYEKMQAYDEALISYNKARISALNSDSANDVRDWALNESIYRRRVTTALNVWNTTGFKNIIEQAQNYIAQTQLRDLTSIKAKYLDLLQPGKSRLDNPATGGSFYLTTVLPGNFATKAWPEFSFNEENVSKYDKAETNGFGTSVSGGWGLFRASASAEGEFTSTNSSIDVKGFKLKCQLVEVPISRPWFKPDFFKSNTWKSKIGQILSNGNRPPDGDLVAYPTSIIFVRDLLTDFAELHKSESTYSQKINTSATVSYGPFSLSASYKRGFDERKFNSQLTESGLFNPGMQIIGFRCVLLPKAPNPNPQIKDWV
ncbi:hypothetical protein [Microcoleus sp. D3_18a_C4]|uniref:hypothetical protein n=1 Tax=Microcoleus sp. D3_18a_C4 TaxID=3055332 RepID=UPI002FD6DE7E